MYIHVHVPRGVETLSKLPDILTYFIPLVLLLIYFVYSLVSIYQTFTRFIGHCPARLAVSTPLYIHVHTVPVTYENGDPVGNKNLYLYLNKIYTLGMGNILIIVIIVITFSCDNHIV